MPQVSCQEAGAACGARFSAATKDELVRQVAEHLQRKHAVKQPTQTILGYIASLAR